MSQYYGVLRVVRVRPTANTAKALQDKYPSGWLPEERLVHLLTHKQTTIGRALSNDLVLMDSTISREHARLVDRASRGAGNDIAPSSSDHPSDDEKRRASGSGHRAATLA